MPSTIPNPSPLTYTTIKALEAPSLMSPDPSPSSLEKDGSKSDSHHTQRGDRHRFSLQRRASHASTSSSSSSSSSASSFKSDSSAASHQKLREWKENFKGWKKGLKMRKREVKKGLKGKVKGTKLKGGESHH